MEILKIKGQELLEILKDPEQFSQIKKDKPSLEHVLENLENQEACELFITNKFLPKELIKKAPREVLKTCVEKAFNPGLDGLLELVKGLKKQDDSLFLKALKTFSTNKYDAGFLRALLQLSEALDLELTLSIKHLLESQALRLIFLKDLKEKSPMLFLKVLLELENELKKEALLLLDPELLNELQMNDELSLSVFSFLIQNDISKFFSNSWSNPPFLRLLSQEKLQAQIPDEEALYFLKEFLKEKSTYYTLNHFGGYTRGLETKIPYRRIYDQLSARVCYLLKEIPTDSRHKAYAFFSGLLDLSAKEAFSYLKAAPKSALSPILMSGSDEETAELLKTHATDFLNFLEGHHITPALLKEALPKEKKLSAEALLAIVSSPYKKQLLIKFPLLKGDSSAGIFEKHQHLISLINQGKAKDFIEELYFYEEGIRDFESGLSRFLNRHAQTTYKKKFEHFHLNLKFLKNLKNEDYALSLVLSFLPLHLRYDEKAKIFSAKNARKILSENRLGVSDCVEICYEAEEFLKLLNSDELSELDHFGWDKEISQEEEKELLLAAELLVAGARKKKPKNVRSFPLLKKVCSLISKEEAKELFYVKPFSTYEEFHLLKFKDGEGFFGSEVLAEAKTVSGYGVKSALEALRDLNAKDELKKVALSVLNKKPDEFNAFFPQAGRRSSDLKALATKILAELGTDTGLDLNALIKKQKSLSALKKLLGENMIELLISHEPKKRLELLIDSSGLDLKKSELILLKEKYELKVSHYEVTKKKHLLNLKYFLDLDIPIEAVGLESAEVLKFEKDDLKIVEELVQKKLKLFCGKNLLALSLKTPLLRSLLAEHSFEELLSEIDTVEDLAHALELGLPVTESKDVAEMVVENKDFFELAKAKGLRFLNIQIPLNEREFEEKKKQKKQLESLGIVILPESEHRFLDVLKKIFNEKGEILEFEPISLKNFSLKDKLDILEMLIEKNPKYKKLLNLDLSDNFVLNPPSLLDKSLISLANMKEILGFGLPQGLSTKEKDSLSDLFLVQGSVTALASKTLKGLLSLAGLSGPMAFEDFFMKSDGGYILSPLCEFLSSLESVAFEQKELFTTLFKDASRQELLSLLFDEGEYTKDFLSDALHAFQSLREALNRFIAVLNEEELSASLILEAMAGNNKALNVLNERLERGDDAAELLRELSGVIKVATVEISIARKKAKEKEPVSLGRVLHDQLGHLQQVIDKITRARKDEQTAKLKTGFEKHNALLEREEWQVPSQKKTYSLYFPENNAEVRKIGSEMGWCTSYNNTYFDNTLSGKAVLFNLKNKHGQVEAQGYLLKNKDGGWLLSQMKYKNNQDAHSDFDEALLKERVLGVIKKDERLKERYSI